MRIYLGVYGKISFADLRFPFHKNDDTFVNQQKRR